MSTPRSATHNDRARDIRIVGQSFSNMAVFSAIEAILKNTRVHGYGLDAAAKILKICEEETNRCHNNLDNMIYTIAADTSSVLNEEKVA